MDDNLDMRTVFWGNSWGDTFGFPRPGVPRSFALTAIKPGVRVLPKIAAQFRA